MGKVALNVVLTSEITVMLYDVVSPDQCEGVNLCLCSHEQTKIIPASGKPLSQKEFC